MIAPNPTISPIVIWLVSASKDVAILMISFLSYVNGPFAVDNEVFINNYYCYTLMLFEEFNLMCRELAELERERWYWDEKIR